MVKQRPGQVNVALDEERASQLRALTLNANYEKEVQFLRQVIGHLAVVTQGQPFDIRQIVLSPTIQL